MWFDCSTSSQLTTNGIILLCVSYICDLRSIVTVIGIKIFAQQLFLRVRIQRWKYLLWYSCFIIFPLKRVVINFHYRIIIAPYRVVIMLCNTLHYCCPTGKYVNAVRRNNRKPFAPYEFLLILINGI